MNCLSYFKSLLLFTIAVSVISCSHKREGKPRVLVFAKTADFHHESIPDGIAAITLLGQKNNFDVDSTTNADYFNDDSLKNYSSVIFLNTTGDVLNNLQEIAFERYIQAGGGYVGVHSATDTEYDWGWYGRLVGAYFNGHPEQQEAVVNVVDKNNEATKSLPSPWKRFDEWYNFKKLNSDVHVLLTLDEKSYKGGTNGDNHPVAWFHDYDGGRAFYTELGHTKESYTDSLYLTHLLGGINYAIGQNKLLDYAKATSQYPPSDDRFTKKQLVTGEFYEPTEMTILPNLDILIVQRRGEIMRYNHETKAVKQVGFLRAYFKANVPGVNAEEGVLGLAKDPDFAKNHFIYIYYSPADTAVNRLSRFTFENDTVDVKTEKVVLDVASQREICCHTGGSIAFGKDNLLFFSAGDNSTPFDEPGALHVNSGYGPTNDIPGHQQYDARRSSSNTNDLRGKINRIKINPDGTYSIPEGNLFPKGTPNTRPEIYVMGNRNPYRISVDQKTGYLYWGEVGPDANNDSFATRGPRGYDEVNQARKAGYFGWPLFVGDNYPYVQYDYATGKSGDPYDAAKPKNNSRNNTGLVDLPPAQPAFIWYPYGASHDFPQLGTGGRNAMVGPVYYTDLYPKETRLPDYYNGKLIISDWIRGWLKAVTMLPNGDFDKMEPFFPSIKMNSAIDIEVGPDGKIYLLEYGSGWFTKNADAGLAVIEYNAGNIAPKITAFNIDKTSGKLPFTINATVAAKDVEKDKITYIWNFGNGITKKTDEPQISYTYETPGDYSVSVTAKDSKGDSSESEKLPLYAGNDVPLVKIDLASSNQSFYIPGNPVKYSVTVTDPNDTSAIDPANLFVSVEYVQGFDKAASTMGHQQGTAAISGKSLTQSLDCKSCHKLAEKSIGPSFTDVSKKYLDNKDAFSYLSGKIAKGGAGVWGEVAMPAHPNLPQEDMSKIVSWILSISKTGAIQKSLPATGSVMPPPATKPGTVLVLSASYTDKGGNNIKALTGTSTASLKSNLVAFAGNEKKDGITFFNYNGANLAIFPDSKGWVATQAIDLTGIKSATLTFGSSKIFTTPIMVEARLDAPDGKLLGTGSLTIAQLPYGRGNISLTPVTDGKLHNIYLVVQLKEKVQGGIASIEFK
jgi:glucose/arabinose dehydrogenase/cytochrome c551/c552